MNAPTQQYFQENQTATESATSTDTQTPLPSSTITDTPTVPPATSTNLPAASATNTITPTALTIPVLSGNYTSNAILVKLRSSKGREEFNTCPNWQSLKIEMEIEQLNILVLQIQEGQVAQALASVSACAGVKYAEPDYLVEVADTIPNDAGFGNQYGLISIRAPQGWDLSTGSTAVTIAIIDSGVDLTHADLAGKIVGGYDFVNNDAVPQDDFGHGTHVAGIAAAISNDAIGIAGVSWGARIMPIKVLNSSGVGSSANTAAGIVWAVDHGAQVINLSLGSTSPSLVMQDAVNYAYSNGVILIAAAGNSGSGTILYPAAFPHVIAVGAVDIANNRAGFSNFGPEMDLVAPGVSIYSTVPGGYNLNSGTSMAAPFVAGLAAILRGLPGGGSPDAIEFEMESTTLDLGPSGRDNLYGYGLIQMDHAIQLLYTPTASTPSTTPSVTLTYAAVSQGNPFPHGGTTPTGTSTQSQFFTITHTATVTPSQTMTPTKQSDVESDLEPLNIPKTKQQSFISLYSLPCIGILLITLGLLLLFSEKNKHKHSTNGLYKNNTRERK